ncbi:RagB/SusD family nutrient uptake outer membrane protein [Maribellus sp. YY47]|uniref:RagB/SusD family nutrient uptake outer membrane protein n=1 Tax=Maribellus sp. YY47 TaxID=2929486 RepID=UPI0020014920|nr:RagB/SusD family nutrient uptake outer membrane protein [Maribellus sp. YY47]MCK3684897.1 RagB/SusD family nutrient uptake outer membrane protein [Maribellus sp. YY47]
MKVKNYLLVFATVVVALALFSSCDDDFLERHYEGGTLDDDQIQETVEALPNRINSSISGMYSLLGKPDGFFDRGSSYRADDAGYPGIALSQDLNSGNMVNVVSGYDWFSAALEYSDRTPTYANPRIRYGLFYKIIYAANDVLSAIPADTDNKQLIYARGQAKAMRAFCYLSLAPYFQFKYVGNEDKPSVPIVEEGTDFRNNPRASLTDLYDYILTNLTDAISDLEGYVRPNKSAIDQNVAYGLRARAYLNMEAWSNAAADADKAMAGYTPYGISELTKPGFNQATDHNWIWALLLPTDVISAGNYATWPSQLGSFSGDAYVAYAGIYRSINVLLYNKINDTDVRKNWWLDENKTSPYLEGLTWEDPATNVVYEGQAIATASIADVKAPMDAYANVKFGQRSGIGSAYNDGDWCMMRAEEMILIKAEALAMGGNPSQGKQVLENFIKTDRDPSYTTSATSAEDLQNEVWLQRRIELWGEGFGMSDAMRLGRNIIRYHPNQPTNVPEDYRFNLSKDDPWLLLRFVQGETNNNVAVEQNEGGAQPSQGDGASLMDGVI